MQAYQQRVIDEKAELDLKREKLKAFMDGESFKHLNDLDAARLMRQAGIMRDYSEILAERIESFQE